MKCKLGSLKRRNKKRAQEDSSSIHVNFSSLGEKHLKAESKDLSKVGIKSNKLSPEKFELFFGENSHIQSAVSEYFGDNHTLFNIHQINKNLAENRGVKWMDDREVERILVKEDDNHNAQIVGVTTTKGEYFYCDKLHFTGGYKVEYIFDHQSKTRFQSSKLRNIVNKIEDTLGVRGPLSTDITTATGVSINALFKNSTRLSRIIDKYGSTGEIAVTNSHWTMIAKDDDHIIMRITGGGNTGSEEYSPAYFFECFSKYQENFW